MIKRLTEDGIISADHPMLHSESGSRFRAFVKQDNYLASVIKAGMERGERLPDASAVWNWFGFLVENFTGKEHLIFDGSPRSVLEAQTLDTALKFLERNKPVVIYLAISREESKRRLLKRAANEGRADDGNLADIERRIDWFERDVAPALDYYRTNGDYLFLEIDGEQSREKIHEDIFAALEESLKPEPVVNA